LQQQQGAAQVSRIVRDGDLRAILQFGQRLNLFGVAGNRVNKGVANRYQLVATIFDLLIQIGLMLESVNVNIPFAQRFIR